MKLCYIVNGASIHAQRWIQPMVARNHRVFVITYQPNSQAIPGTADFIDLTQKSALPKLRFLQWGLWIRQYLKRIQPDILHAHQIPAAGWMGAMAGFHPFVVTGWGSDILLEPKKSAFRKLLVRIVLARADILTVPSSLMFNTARDLGFPEQRLRLIPWGVETNIFKPDRTNRLETRRQFGLPEHAPVIFCPRGVHPVYNLDIIAAATHALLPRFPDLRLILLKYNPQAAYLKQIEEQIASTQMGANVIWLPAQESPEKMAHLYQCSDVVLSIPSSEGYGFTTYEAMACGTPTVISDLPVFESDLQDRVHTLKVPVRDTHRTAQAIETILTDKQLQQVLVENSLSKCAGLSVEHRITQVETLYQNILEGNLAAF